MGLICASCKEEFTHAGYSRHLSMTARNSCRALYNTCLDQSTAHNPPGISGPEDGDPNGSFGLEICDSSEYLHWLDHASNLTSHSRWQWIQSAC